MRIKATQFLLSDRSTWPDGVIDREGHGCYIIIEGMEVGLADKDWIVTKDDEMMKLSDKEMQAKVTWFKRKRKSV